MEKFTTGAHRTVRRVSSYGNDEEWQASVFWDEDTANACPKSILLTRRTETGTHKVWFDVVTHDKTTAAEDTAKDLEKQDHSDLLD